MFSQVKEQIILKIRGRCHKVELRKMKIFYIRMIESFCICTRFFSSGLNSIFRKGGWQKYFCSAPLACYTRGGWGYLVLSNFIQNINISLFSLSRISFIFKDKIQKKGYFIFLLILFILIFRYLFNQRRVKRIKKQIFQKKPCPQRR